MPQIQLEDPYLAELVPFQTEEGETILVPVKEADRLEALKAARHSGAKKKGHGKATAVKVDASPAPEGPGFPAYFLGFCVALLVLANWKYLWETASGWVADVRAKGTHEPSRDEYPFNLPMSMWSSQAYNEYMEMGPDAFRKRGSRKRGKASQPKAAPPAAYRPTPRPAPGPTPRPASRPAPRPGPAKPDATPLDQTKWNIPD